MLQKQNLPTTVIFCKEQIKSDANVVWNTIATPGILEFCHPFCKENKVTKWGEVGSKDSIVYYNNLKLYRFFTEWNEKKGYTLLIGRGNVAVAEVFWNVEAINDKITSLSISIHIFTDIALKSYPKFLRPLLKYIYLIPKMSHYIKSVVKGFKYYIETGKTVEKNMFGLNKMFSTKTLAS